MTLFNKFSESQTATRRYRRSSKYRPLVLHHFVRSLKGFSNVVVCGGEALECAVHVADGEHGVLPSPGGWGMKMRLAGGTKESILGQIYPEQAFWTDKENSFSTSKFEEKKAPWRTVSRFQQCLIHENCVAPRLPRKMEWLAFRLLVRTGWISIAGAYFRPTDEYENTFRPSEE